MILHIVSFGIYRPLQTISEKYGSFGRAGISQKVYFLANDYIVSNTKKFSTVSPKNQELLSIFPVNSDKTPVYEKLSQKVHFLEQFFILILLL